MRLLNVVVLARLLDPNDFGLMSAAFVVAGISYVLSDFGVGYTLVQRPNVDKDLSGTGLTLSLITGLLLACIVWATSGHVARFFNMPELEDMLQVLALVFPLKSISIPAESLIQRNLEFGKLAKIDIISYSFGYFVISVFLAYVGFGVWALTISFVGEALVRTSLLLLIAPETLRPRFKLASLSQFANLGTGASIARFSNFAANQVDKLVVGRVLGTIALGEYERAYQLMVMPANLIGQVVGRVLFPAMARVQHNKQALRVNYRRSLSLTALVTLPVSILIAILSEDLVAVLLGPGWERAVPAFQILGSVLAFRSSYKMSDEIARANGAVYAHTWRQIVYAIATLIAAIIGSQTGITSVAYGVALAIFLNFLLMTNLGMKITGLRFSELLRAHIPAAFLATATALSCIVIATVSEILALPSLITVLVSVVAIVTIGLITLRFSPRILGEDAMWALNTVQNHVPQNVELFLRRFTQAS